MNKMEEVNKIHSLYAEAEKINGEERYSKITQQDLE